jgi:hypothetical protein
MNQRVNEQMATRNHAEELAVDHMCDPCEWMPVPRVKGAKRPGDSRERNAAIHHWIILDIRGVIERDEVMPYQLRIDPKRYYRQTEQDENVGSLECRSSACVSSATGRTRRGELAFAQAENGIFLPGCGVVPVFSLLRVPFSHALCESWLGTPSLSSLPSVGFSASQREFLQKTAKETKVGIGSATSSLSSLPSVYFLVGAVHPNRLSEAHHRLPICKRVQPRIKRISRMFG